MAGLSTVLERPKGELECFISG
jgi:cleavage stimulation factor subunit 3